MNASNPKRYAEPPTADRLRADIDGGSTGEKVRFPDPAAAPLGADDEAAGTPLSPEQRQMEHDSRKRGISPAREEPGALLLYILLIGGVALVVIGALALLWV